VTNEPTPGHAHEASLDDALDFVNTLEFSRDGSTEHLPTEGDALAWLAARGLLHREGVAPASGGHRGPSLSRTPSGRDRLHRDGQVLDRLRRVRAALREVGESVAEGRAARPDALAEVNRALRARSIVELVPGPDGVTVGHRHVGDPLDDALATLVEPIVRELTAGRRDRLRICANDSCRWVFFDESRTGRRRWCDMATCGNRAKAARHRARLRGGEPGAGRPAAG
jgi:predicted RNA-binding Zn ribbon-like protein